MTEKSAPPGDAPVKAEGDETMGAETPRAQKVYIVDDDGALRQSVAWLMESVQLQTESFASAVEFLQRFHPSMRGCVVLDLRMPRMSGLELQEALAETGCDLPIIFVTGHGEVSSAVQALKGGAFDFIEKPFSNNRLLERVQAALAYEAERWEKARAEARIRLRFTQCTARELQVLDHLVAGASNKQVADALDISIKTVEVHRARLMEKTESASFAELVRLALARDAR
ncbi:response regulator [Myxococcota bacterium]|nr:response regulator [Myxococcota bacterium]